MLSGVGLVLIHIPLFLPGRAAGGAAEAMTLWEVVQLRGASRELCCDASVSKLPIIVTKIPGVINTKEETFILAQVFVGFF